MDQKEAREVAARIGGIATQISRLNGRFALPGEEWVVQTADGRVFTTKDEEDN